MIDNLIDENKITNSLKIRYLVSSLSFFRKKPGECNGILSDNINYVQQLKKVRGLILKNFVQFN
ncbi:hypothetical protein JCM12298_08010 [Desulfothermus naphthae]